MASTTTKVAKVTDYHGKCKECGASLVWPETIITWWDHVSSDGSSGKRINEKGISRIDLNAGVCDACQVKMLRRELNKIASNTDNPSGLGAVLACVIGLSVSALALLLKATRVDQFGQQLPFIKPWFYIWAALGVICLVGLPVAIARRKRLCGNDAATASEDLKLDDKALLAKYSVKDGVPYMKWAWSDYMVKQSKTGSGGLVYASEMLRMGSPEVVSRELGIRSETAAYLLDAARQYPGARIGGT